MAAVPGRCRATGQSASAAGQRAAAQGSVVPVGAPLGYEVDAGVASIPGDGRRPGSGAAVTKPSGAPAALAPPTDSPPEGDSGWQPAPPPARTRQQTPAAFQACATGELDVCGRDDSQLGGTGSRNRRESRRSPVARPSRSGSGTARSMSCATTRKSRRRSSRSTPIRRRALSCVRAASERPPDRRGRGARRGTRARYPLSTTTSRPRSTHLHSRTNRCSSRKRRGEHSRAARGTNELASLPKASSETNDAALGAAGPGDRRCRSGARVLVAPDVDDSARHPRTRCPCRY